LSDLTWSTKEEPSSADVQFLVCDPDIWNTTSKPQTHLTLMLPPDWH